MRCPLVLSVKVLAAPVGELTKVRWCREKKMHLDVNFSFNLTVNMRRLHYKDQDIIPMSHDDYTQHTNVQFVVAPNATYDALRFSCALDN
jgi:hypothetical protein